jgi:dienelactone hydrolase
MTSAAIAGEGGRFVRAERRDGHVHSFDRTAPVDVELGPLQSGVVGRGLLRTLSYASPRGGRVPAMFVTPFAEAAVPAVLFLHHGGRQTPAQLLQEADELAGEGMASMFVDAPWLRAERRQQPRLENAFALFEQAGVDLLRGVQVLGTLPYVDAGRLAFVGHGFGAHLGALVAAEAEVSAVVLMAGSASMSRAIQDGDHPFWAQREADADTVAAAGEAMAALDAERYIARSRVPVFHQFGTRDGLVSDDMAHEYLALTPDPRVVRFYDADHGLGEQARVDRREFLRFVLGATPRPPRTPERPEPRRTSEELTLRLPLFYPAADAHAYRVRRDQTYRTVGGRAYPLDAYQPAAPAGPRPAVVIVHGQAHPSLLRDAKEWASLQGLAGVIAARGMVAVVPNVGAASTGPGLRQQLAHAPLVADNVVAAVRHVQAHAVGLGVDRRRIAVWTMAEGGLYALGPALEGELDGAVRCVVALYPELSVRRLAAAQPPLPASALERMHASALLGRRRPPLPVLVVRAGRDEAEANEAIDAFAEKAYQAQASVTVVRHDLGHRGFETVDATSATQAVLERALVFLERNLETS